MRRLTPILAVLVAAGSLAWGATPVYVSSDVPTTIGTVTLLPWQIYRYDAAGPTYTLMLTVPGGPNVDAIHKMDTAGGWLLSVDAPNDLGGALPTDAEPQDVVMFKGGVYSIVFCPGLLGVPPGVNLDGVYTEGGDGGRLVVSFDVPVELPSGSGTWYDPADLVRWTPAGAGCAGWAFAGANPVFDASASGAGIPTSDNVIDADQAAGQFVLSLDVPSTLLPSAGPLTDYAPGQLASWDVGVGVYDDWEILSGWPIASKVDGLSCLANPGRVPPTLTMAKAAIPAGDVVLNWSTSCSTEGAQNYAIYQGTIGTWYSHVALDCSDDGVPLSEQVTPAVGSSYYLVVPRNYKGEGSYGTRSSGIQRPVGGGACATPQVVTSCP